MPLDNPIVHGVVPVDVGGPETSDDAKTVEDDIFERMEHWVGANGEWIAFAQRPGRWYLQNVYTMVQVELPLVQRVGIDQYKAQWYPCPL